jgi:hypothetical protein
LTGAASGTGPVSVKTTEKSAIQLTVLVDLELREKNKKQNKKKKIQAVTQESESVTARSEQPAARPHT